ncbi:hypothetical protein [Vreelandella sp. EE22]
MTPEVTRRHYLDAMGITAWACRFQLPNAAPTQACEWEEPAAAVAPRQQLHALLEEPAPPARPQPTPASTPEVGRSPDGAPIKSARALLGDIAPPERIEQAPAPEAPARVPESRTQPVVFTLTCACINGRWLSVHPGEPSALEQRLLGNMLIAAGALDEPSLHFTTFNWPPVADAFAAEDPLEEAREGVAAFVAGSARRQGWQLERLLWWSDEPDESGAQGQSADALTQVLDLRQDQSHTLALPVWRAPSLQGLVRSAAAKRALWPALMALTQDASTNAMP